MSTTTDLDAAMAELLKKAQIDVLQTAPSWIEHYISYASHVMMEDSGLPFNEVAVRPEYEEILRINANLRRFQARKVDARASVITVRIPREIYESLRSEAHSRKTSLNQLCVSKLLRGIHSNLVS